MTIAPIDSSYSPTLVHNPALGTLAQDSLSPDQTTNQTHQSKQANHQNNDHGTAAANNNNSNSKPIEDTVHLSTLPSQVQVLTRQGETPQEVATQLGLTVNIVDSELGVQVSKLGTDALTTQQSVLPANNAPTFAR